MISASPNTADWWMLAGILILLLCLIMFAIAEMGLSRVSKPKAQALADSGARGGAAVRAGVGGRAGSGRSAGAGRLPQADDRPGSDGRAGPLPGRAVRDPGAVRRVRRPRSG